MPAILCLQHAAIFAVCGRPSERGWVSGMPFGHQPSPPAPRNRQVVVYTVRDRQLAKVESGNRINSGSWSPGSHQGLRASCAICAVARRANLSRMASTRETLEGRPASYRSEDPTTLPYHSVDVRMWVGLQKSVAVAAWAWHARARVCGSLSATVAAHRIVKSFLCGPPPILTHLESRRYGPLWAIVVFVFSLPVPVKLLSCRPSVASPSALGDRRRTSRARQPLPRSSWRSVAITWRFLG